MSCLTAVGKHSLMFDISLKPYFKFSAPMRVHSCPRGFCCCNKLYSSYQVSNIAEIFLVNQEGALVKQLDPGR